MPDLKFLWLLLAMAGVTYLIRVLPLVFIKRQIRSPFIRSFLYYVPYSVLTVMTFPAVFYSTGHIISAAIGTVSALVLAYFKKPLLPVALAACAAVLVSEVFIFYIFV